MKIYIVIGPTSSGKTSLAIDLCKKFSGEIISADSRQTVKYMDIGTGKLPIIHDYPIQKGDEKWVIDGVKVWGYDLTEPDTYFSGVDWSLFALDKVRTLIEQGTPVFLVGGTGFYIDLFTGRVQPSHIEPDFSLRKELEQLSLKDLQDRLTTLASTEIKKIDAQNPVRLIRAIEKEIGRKKNTTPLPYLTDTEFLYMGLTAPREILYNRVDQWTESIWENGLIDEVIKLNDLGYSTSAKLSGLVYKQAQQYIHKELTEQEAVQQIKFSLHAYVRRQQTYFKKMPNIHWSDITHDDYKEKIYTLVNG